MLQVLLIDCQMSVMSIEGDKIQNMIVILVCVILGSYGSDNEKMPSCDMRCHVFWFFLKHDFTCSMPENICDSGHNMLPVAQFLKMFIVGSGF